MQLEKVRPLGLETTVGPVQVSVEQSEMLSDKAVPQRISMRQVALLVLLMLVVCYVVQLALFGKAE